MNQEEEKPTEDYEHGENEFSSNDDSEKIEWEQHYKRRNEKLVKEDGFDQKMFYLWQNT